MSLYRRKDSSASCIQVVTTVEKSYREALRLPTSKSPEYHDRLKASLCKQERLSVKPRYSWQQALSWWIEETSDKSTHKEDVQKLK